MLESTSRKGGDLAQNYSPEAAPAIRIIKTLIIISLQRRFYIEAHKT